MLGCGDFSASWDIRTTPGGCPEDTRRTRGGRPEDNRRKLGGRWEDTGKTLGDIGRTLGRYWEVVSRDTQYSWPVLVACFKPPARMWRCRPALAAAFAASARGQYSRQYSVKRGELSDRRPSRGESCQTGGRQEGRVDGPAAAKRGELTDTGGRQEGRFDGRAAVKRGALMDRRPARGAS